MMGLETIKMVDYRLGLRPRLYAALSVTTGPTAGNCGAIEVDITFTVVVVIVVYSCIRMGGWLNLEIYCIDQGVHQSEGDV